MEKFANYLAAFDGTGEWTQIRPLFDDLFHRDCVVVTADGELNKEQWAEMAKGLVENRATVSGFEVTGEEDDALYYKLTVHVGEDDPLHMTAKGTVKDGQLVRVEPVDPAAYSRLVERSE